VYVQAAFGEETWRRDKRIRFVLYGHTHDPACHVLDGAGGREVFYLNTGTWRNRIQRTVGLDRGPDFAELKQMTYSVFYAADEDTGSKEAGTVSFDMWTGMKKKQYRF
jgi:hypothetical protein